MRVHVDLGSHFTTGDEILQVDSDPAYNALSNITGRFLIPAADGTAVSITSASSTVAGGGSVPSQIFGQLLARFPQYRYIAYNPLLTAADLAALDGSATFDVLIPDPAGGPNPVLWQYGCRFQSGDVAGAMPMGTALLPRNMTTVPPRPGLLITANIDLTAATSGVGADDFMVYWKIYTVSTTDDVAGTGLGSSTGLNTPALKYAREIDQEPAQFQCYLSVDDGQNWVQVSRLQQVAFCGKTNQVKLAFTNGSSSSTFHIAHYALLF